MNKIVCDICGTAYPETAEQCPICGSAKQVDSKVIAETSTESAEQSAKTATKGGHFSNSNVKKRNKGKKVPATVKKPAKPAKAAPKTVEHKPQEEQSNQPEEKNEKSNRGLMAVVWVLLIAVILVLAYIVVQFVLPMYGIELPELLKQPTETTAAIVDTTAQEDIVPEDTSVACTGLTIVGGDIVLDGAGRAWLLEVTVEPGNTTDVVTYASADENVATVSDQGRVTAMGPGKTVITVTCGDLVREISVECSFGEVTTVPEETTIPEETTVPATSEEPTEESTEESTEEPTESTEATEPPAEDFGLFEQDDVTLTYKGETFEFESGDVYLSEIVWSTNNPAIATVENGEVTAVGPGITTIYGEYNGQKDSCIIRCEFGDEAEEPEEDEDENSDYPRLWPSTDVSIRLDERFDLEYVNADGEWTDIEWYSDDEDVAVVSGNEVTGVGYGTATIYGTYNGKEITCIVRVRSDLE